MLNTLITHLKLYQDLVKLMLTKLQKMDVLRSNAVYSDMNRLRVMQHQSLPLQALKDVYEVDCLECLAVALLQSKDFSFEDLYQLVLHRSFPDRLSDESAAVPTQVSPGDIRRPSSAKFRDLCGQHSSGLLSAETTGAVERQLRNFCGYFIGETIHGYGIQCENGSITEGEWVRGVLHGQGSQFSHSYNNSYCGSFRHGQRDGYGLASSSGGEWRGIFKDNQLIFGVQESRCSTYTGELVNYAMNGFGVLTTDRFTYVGEWSCSKRHGHGKLTVQPDCSSIKRYHLDLGLDRGDSFEGNWCRNEITGGQGVLRKADGTLFTGEFTGPNRGSGSIEFTDGARYRGAWIKCKMTGTGQLSMADGTVYEGGFRDGKLEGRGRLKLANGDCIVDCSFSKNGLTEKCLLRSAERTETSIHLKARYYQGRLSMIIEGKSFEGLDRRSQEFLMMRKLTSVEYEKLQSEEGLGIWQI
jgi:hypothetical protein